MWTRSCFSISFSFYLVPFSFFAKSVGRWTSSDNSEDLMAIIYVSLFKSVEMWTKSCLSISCFLSFLYLLNFLQKVWTGGQAMIILKILMATICISLFKSVDMWTKSCLSISCFLSFLYLLNFLQKVWTGGQALKKNSTQCISLLESIKSVDMWTRSSLSISYFLSFLYPLKYLKKVWTGGQESVFLFHVFFLSLKFKFFCKKCGRVDKKLCFYSCFLSFVYPPKFFAKGVDRRTSSENSDNFNDKNYVFHYSKVWICGQEAVFLFHFFFLPFTL